jgi:3-deoxy-D-manno-octulosonic acid kinase
MNLPEGYRCVRHVENGVDAFACTTASGWLTALLEEGVRLHDWGARHAGSEAFNGRGLVHVAPAPASGPDGRERWAFRHYHRGGAARLLADWHLRGRETRPVTELRVSVDARARGVRTPAVVAGAAYGRGAIYRADLVTELVPDAVALRDLLFGHQSVSDASAPLRSAGRLVRALEEARMLHSDLNAGNVLIDAGSEEAWVVDLDRCHVLTSGGPRPGDGMRRRLERSLRKLAVGHDRPLSVLEWQALHDGFEDP